MFLAQANVLHYLVSAETPDPMWGLAGVGYFHLRLAEPRRIPTVLLPGCRCGS
jgi:hypothetical protein